MPNLAPFSLPVTEDKLVQSVLNKILNAIYEVDFLEDSYGFRPNRSCHDAVIALDRYIGKKVSYIVDADIKGFFDNVSHEWMMKFLRHRIGDTNILRLIHRFLKSGVMEEGKIEVSEKGTPQGGIISPTLANVYLHYVLDLWFERVVKKYSEGEAYLVRYADDFVCCFQYKKDAERFYKALIERLRSFGLEVAEEKTKIIQFGRFAESDRNEKGLGKPETFDFLGFTHYCSKNKTGHFRVKRKTSKKKFSSSLKRTKKWLKSNMHKPVKNLIDGLNSVLRGHYNYYDISGNSREICLYYRYTRKMLFRILNRRSQRKSYTWEKFESLTTKFPLEKARLTLKTKGLWLSME